MVSILDRGLLLLLLVVRLLLDLLRHLLEWLLVLLLLPKLKFVNGDCLRRDGDGII